MIAIEEWRPEPAAGPQLESELTMLAGVLHATVHAGASVGFVLPFPMDDARVFWIDKVLPAVRQGARRMLLARSEGEIVGTVHLILDTMPNQSHRAEVSKLLVHPSARRRGIARALMNTVEGIARAEGRTLLTLDTRTGDSAEPLYVSLGYVLAGVIPRFARAPVGSALDATSILFKELAGR